MAIPAAPPVSTTPILEDTFVSFEEYRYWADIKHGGSSDNGRLNEPPSEKGLPASTNLPSTAGGFGPGRIPEESSPSVRTAGWCAVFYLITTDILGPFSTPWAFAQMGYGIGVAIYVVFGLLSTYSGWILWKTFLGLDSDRYPLRGYGDYFYRIFGPASCRLVNICQSLHLLMAVSVTILFMGQSISQISQGPSDGPSVCFIVCLLIFTVAGIILGQIRTLQRFSWVAHGAVWLSCIVLIICVAVAATSPPNFASAIAQYGPDFSPGPVLRFAGRPPAEHVSGGAGFVGTINGLNQAVVAYGGAMLFAAFLAEMRHPRDFFKSLICAEAFICALYIFFGLFIYSYQGQFTLNPAMQGLSPYQWQTAANALSLGSGLAAATLYSNVGLKVAYVEVLQKLLGAPDLASRRGKVYWAILVPIYWLVAFILCASVPMFSFVSGLVGALFIMSFSYTFPALIMLGYTIKSDTMVEMDSGEEAVVRYRGVGTGFKRVVQGFKKRPLFNALNTVYMFGALVTSVLGIYTSVVAIAKAFQGNSAASSWGCTPPV